MSSFRTTQVIVCAGLLAFLLVGCRAGNATPTALPPGVVRPAQPAPQYPAETGRFTIVTPRPPVIVADENSIAIPFAGGVPVHDRVQIVLPLDQTPSALGIVRGNTTLRSAPDGPVVQSLIIGETVTVTGRSAGGTHYALYTEDGATGWVSTSALHVYGADDLQVVERSAGPGPVATLLAEAMQPVEPSVLATFELDK